jgi:hypothetical protein
VPKSPDRGLPRGVHGRAALPQRPGLYNHLHCLVTDGAYEEQGNELRFLAAPPPTPERMTAVLAEVHEVIRAADDDLDPALAACLQPPLAGPRVGAMRPGTPETPTDAWPAMY